MNNKKLPDSPGVYFFKKGRKVLYIGKATSLRDRVRSYFSGDITDSRGPLIVRMLEEATGVGFQETDSVLEALILEAALIKKHQPHYNTREKSDKSFNYVVVTDEDFPRIFSIRGRELEKLEAKSYKLKASYGPFPSGGQLREALKIVRKIFPFRGKGDPAPQGGARTSLRRSRLNQELGLAPDFSKITKREYSRTIRNLKLFFDGKKKSLLTTLEREMKTYAKKHEFEKAEQTKRQIFALKHIRDVALIKSHGLIKKVEPLQRVEAYDVAHISGTGSVGVMVVVEGGEPKKSEYKKFRIRSAKAGSDTGALREILERRLKHNEWSLPKLIVIDGGKAQKNTAEKVLKDFGYEIPVAAVTKDERHRARRILGEHAMISKNEEGILLANKEAHRFAVSYHRNLRKIK